MKTMDEILESIDEDRPQDIHDAPHDAIKDPDEEDIEELLTDCHDLLVTLLDVKHSKGVTKEIEVLHARLAEVLGWYTYH